MKSSLLIFSIIFYCTANAQIEKGSKLLGGSLNFNYSTDPVTTSNSGTKNFYISTQFANAYKDNNFRGFQIGYGTGNQAYNKNNYVFGGIFYRKYIPIVKEFYFFGEANFNIGYTSAVSEYPGSAATNINQEIYSAAISLMPGLSYAINRNFHLEIAFFNIASLHYQHQKEKHITGSITNSSSSDNIGLNGSTQLTPFSYIQFGFRFLLQKKKLK